jgi:hypothetical protein
MSTGTSSHQGIHFFMMEYTMKSTVLNVIQMKGIMQIDSETKWRDTLVRHLNLNLNFLLFLDYQDNGNNLDTPLLSNQNHWEIELPQQQQYHSLDPNIYELKKEINPFSLDDNGNFIITFRKRASCTFMKAPNWKIVNKLKTHYSG